MEHLSRRGYRFFGTATLHRDDEIAREAMRRVFAEERAPYPVNCVVLVAVERMDHLVSPGYLHAASEQAIRDSWRKRRADLDARFEEHAAGHPFIPDSAPPPPVRLDSAAR